MHPAPMPDPAPAAVWRTACLGPFELGETCLHRWTTRRLLLAEVCEGCVRLLMDALTTELPDLVWHRSWWARAGRQPEGGGPDAG